jgi:ribonuclease Z
LKRGETITLPSGKVVLPENVLAEESELDERATLILRCDDPHLIPSLVASSLLAPYYSKMARLRYVVHLTRNEVFISSTYQAWMKSLGGDVQHVVVNGTGPLAPLSMDITRHQNLLSRLHARVFPRLLAADYDGTGKEVRVRFPCHFMGKLQDEKMPGEVIAARPNQRFVLRGSCNQDVLVDDTGETRGECERSESAEFNTQLAVFKQGPSFETPNPVIVVAVCDTVSTKEVYPRVTLLGTGSATFTKLRNVSATLLEVHSHSAMLIDCGEGTWGQLRVLFPDRVEELMRDLHMILITHAHQDHCFGIYTIIQQRRRVFHEAGICRSFECTRVGLVQASPIGLCCWCAIAM